MKGQMISFLFFLLSATASAETFDLNKIFNDRDFRPSVPALTALEAAYGKGSYIRGTNGTAYTVYAAQKSYCLVARYEDQLSDPDIQELIIIAAPFCKAFKKKSHIALGAATLTATQIGISTNELKESSRPRPGKVELLGSKYKILEFNPTKEPDLYARYYVCRGKVVGFSLGVTE